MEGKVFVPESGDTTRGLQGLRVLSLQSRHAELIVKLIENEGGEAISAPSMREVPLKDNSAALAFAEDPFEGKFDLIIFLTGVGTRILFDAVETKYPRQKFVDALSGLPVVARGPKVVSALRQFAVPIAIAVPEPNTWRDIVKALVEHPRWGALEGKRVVIQEYGVSNRELVEALQARGATVTSVPVYEWELPEDLEPLRRAIRAIVEGSIDVLLLTSANQVHHMMQVASESGLQDSVRRALQRVLIVSVGPISTEGLRQHGIAADLEPAHPRMGQLVHETATKAKELLRRKRGDRSGQTANSE